MAQCENKFLLKNMPRLETLRKLSDFWNVPSTDEALMGLAAYHAMLETSGDLLHDLNSYMLRHGITQARFRTLMVIMRSGPEGCTPSRLAEELVVERATVTSLLDGLEKEGFIRRMQADGDRRSIRIVMLPEGERRARAAMPGRAKYIQELMRTLSTRECAQLIDLLDKLRASAASLRTPTL